jgi:pimeloyl-ACP methyl ester carboxylesterase
VWRIPGNESGVFQPLDLTLVFHHGSGTAMNFFVRDFERVAHLGVRVFAYDYPGFGRSSGTPTEDAIYAGECRDQKNFFRD